MRVLFIRHGAAEPRIAHQPDELRALTDVGRKKLQKAARGLQQVCASLDVLASSPLKRAVQTAQIVSDIYSGVRPVELPELLPDQRPQILLRWLQTQKAGATIALVGHEPHLSTAASWLLTGTPKPLLSLKKAGACLLGFDRDPSPGAATLLWLLEPSHLRAMR